MMLTCGICLEKFELLPDMEQAIGHALCILLEISDNMEYEISELHGDNTKLDIELTRIQNEIEMNRQPRLGVNPLK